METKRSLAYLRAKKKVETLKGFYSHLIVYILVNTAIILVSANVFNNKPIDFTGWENYITLFFWGFGIVSHALYVFYAMNMKNNFFKRSVEFIFNNPLGNLLDKGLMKITRSRWQKKSRISRSRSCPLKT